jgi:hypothetical protein
MSTGAEPDTSDAMEEMEELLLSIARRLSTNRADAISYSRCRSALLEAPVKDLLPGFIYQCLTVYKFKDFISLYDPDTALREAFVARMFERCRAMAEQVGIHDNRPGATDPTNPQQWML